MKQEAKHWYLLSFMVQQPGTWTPSSFLLASDTENLTVPQINNAKLLNNIPGTSVLMSISKVAYDTERGINGQPDIEQPSVLSEAYTRGVIAAVTSSSTDTVQPDNPFLKPMPTEHDKADAQEWVRGFSSIRGVQQQHATANPTPDLASANKPSAPVVTPGSLGKGQRK